MLRGLLRKLRARPGQNKSVWPMLLFLSAVLVPAICVLWFMSAAMRNEQFAARQQLADAYRTYLTAARLRLQKSWADKMAALETAAEKLPPPAAFAQCVLAEGVDGVVLFDAQGRVAYPDRAVAAKGNFGENETTWREAIRLEDQQQFVAAATRFQALAQLIAAQDRNGAARAYQAQVRCLARAGQKEAVIQLAENIFSNDLYAEAVDPHGRLIAAHVELLALEYIPDRNSTRFRSLDDRLAERLTNYHRRGPAAPQRRFLMTTLQDLSPERFVFPTLPAEQRAAALSEHMPGVATGTDLRTSILPAYWQCMTPNHRVLAIIHADRLREMVHPAPGSDGLPTDMILTLDPPSTEAPNAFVTLAAGEPMPGWRLAIALKDQARLHASAARRITRYLWTGMLVVAVTAILSCLALRLVRRQLHVARLKNDLAATVSHELKTPLSSMRVLIDTLLDAEHLDEPRTRDYLRLIAGENERLTRLIQNFLTFSRLERKKYAFHFTVLPARQIVETAVQSVRARFDASDYRLEVDVDDQLPAVRADPDALAAALINLLENAHKYSASGQPVHLSAHPVDGRVQFRVRDNGVGIAPRERRKIFQPFYQIDQHLSRRGEGCGLGLSIVHFIIDAHCGSTSVDSQPGCGSTFIISLPVADAQEVMA